MHFQPSIFLFLMIKEVRHDSLIVFYFHAKGDCYRLTTIMMREAVPLGDA
jgi:hypothetical protein